MKVRLQTNSVYFVNVSLSVIKYKIFIFFFSITFVFLSCQKRKAKIIAGSYFCTVNYSYWEITQIDIDSTWDESITVENEKKSIVILNNLIPIDCLKVNEFYSRGDHNSNFRIKIAGDSLYYGIAAGGLGGGSSWYYRCNKID